jgi:hypothetical protein
MGAVRAIDRYLNGSVAHDVQRVRFLPLLNQRNPARLVAHDFALPDQVFDKLLRNTLEQLESLGEHADRAFLVAFGHHPPRDRVAHQKGEAMAWNVEQSGIVGRGHYVACAWLATDCAQLAKKVALGKRRDFKGASVSRTVVEVDGSAQDETEVKLIFTFASGEFPARKTVHAHERFAFESPDEREAFFFGKIREQLKARELLPQLRRLDRDDGTRFHRVSPVTCAR